MNYPEIPYKVIGIDPGLNHTGWGIIEVTASGYKYVASGVCNITKGETYERLGEIAQRLGTILSTFSPNIASIEKVFVNVNPQSTLLLGQARGAAITALALAGLHVKEYSATEIKQAITGSGRANKEMVEFMVGKLLNLKDFERSDEADALSCAICCANTIKLRKIEKLGTTTRIYATPRRGASERASRSAWTNLVEKKIKRD